MSRTRSKTPSRKTAATLGETMAKETNRTAMILRRKAMESASIRLPADDMARAKAAAKTYRCPLADVLRTAVHEWLDQVDLGGEEA